MKDRLPVFAAALWWGSLTAVGCWVVPLLFVNLATPAIAGAMAARLFSAQTWVSAVCGLLLLMASSAKFRGNQAEGQVDGASTALVFIVGGILLALLSEFAVAPRIVARENLKLWHSIGTGMYLLQWLCAATVLWKSAATKPGRPGADQRFSN